MKNDIAVSIKNVKKQFDLPQEKEDSIKLKVISNLQGKSRNQNIRYKALRGVNLDIKKGEFIGILGRNGAGKSTLLKIIAQIYQPTSGSVKVKGKLVPFIELGVGFNPNLSGRDNVYLNGAMLGFTRKEVDAMYDEIVEFAELEEFMDQKLKNYSSGMQVRLAFSVAIKAEADILLLDEVLAVGDVAFQNKCYDYFDSLKGGNKTIILVSHNVAVIKKYCDRAVLINEGKVAYDGTADETAEKYLELFSMAGPDSSGNKGADDTDKKVEIMNVKSSCSPERLEVEVDLRSEVDMKDLKLAIRILNRNGVAIAGTNTHIVENPVSVELDGGKTKRIKFSMPNILGNGTFSVDARVGPADYTGVLHDKAIGVARFFNQRDEAHYPVALQADIKVEQAE